jgi:hypothetical protein
MPLEQRPIRFFAATSLLDLGTDRLKFLRKMSILGLNRRDKKNLPSVIKVGYSDTDDFNTPFTNFTHTVDNNSTHMVLRQLGQFRRRIFYFEHTDNAPLVLEALEFETEEGMH